MKNRPVGADRYLKHGVLDRCLVGVGPVPHLLDRYLSGQSGYFLSWSSLGLTGSDRLGTSVGHPWLAQNGTVGDIPKLELIGIDGGWTDLTLVNVGQRWLIPGKPGYS